MEKDVTLVSEGEHVISATSQEVREQPANVAVLLEDEECSWPHIGVLCR
jgi:hypothetical protein